MPTKKDGDKEEAEESKGGLASTLLAIGGLALAWTAIELAFKPWLQKGRDSLRKSLDPNYDPDDEHTPDPQNSAGKDPSA